jgi:hypothetical protein
MYLLSYSMASNYMYAYMCAYIFALLPGFAWCPEARPALWCWSWVWSTCPCSSPCPPPSLYSHRCVAPIRVPRYKSLLSILIFPCLHPVLDCPIRSIWPGAPVPGPGFQVHGPAHQIPLCQQGPLIWGSAMIDYVGDFWMTRFWDEITWLIC